jgi:excisionase family DNA binding protein
MISERDVSTWPNIMDVVRHLRVSQSRVSQLVHNGKLHAVRTRAGWLVDPASVAQWQAEREARKVKTRR